MSQPCHNLRYFFGAKTTAMVFKYNRKFLKVRLDLKIVCHCPTDQTLEVPTQNILLDLLKQKKKTFPKVKPS